MGNRRQCPDCFEAAEPGLFYCSSCARAPSQPTEEERQACREEAARPFGFWRLVRGWLGG